MDIASRRWERRCRMVARMVPQGAHRRHAYWPESVKSCRPREGRGAHSALVSLERQTLDGFRSLLQRDVADGALGFLAAVAIQENRRGEKIVERS